MRSSVVVSVIAVLATAGAAPAAVQEPDPKVEQLASQQGPLEASADRELTLVGEEDAGEVLRRSAGLDVEAVPLSEALRELHDGSGVPLLFSPSFIPERTVDCACSRVSVRDALTRLLRDSGLEFMAYGDQVIIARSSRPEVARELPRLAALPAPAHPVRAGLSPAPERAAPRPTRLQGTVSGMVRDADTGQPLASVQVHIPEQGMGVLTRANGRFLLQDVPAGTHTIEAERIGYRRAVQEVTVQSDEAVEINFELSESALALDEIVVTGTAEPTRRRQLGVAMDQVQVDEILADAPDANFSQLLSGRSAGTVVLQQSGLVSSGAVLNLRGVGSLTLSGSPILYVDGVRMDNSELTGPWSGSGPSRMNDINPRDIESIEIIKGPAASTLYGTEASDGVIQIITKQGRSGEAAIDVYMKQGANWLMDPEGRIPSNFYRTESGEVIEQNLVRSEKEAGRNIFYTGHTQSYGVSARGGLERMGYFVSADFDDQEGIFPSDWLKNFRSRANVNAQLADDFDVRLGLGLVSSEMSRAPEGFSGQYGIMPMVLWGSPSTRDTPLRGFLRAPPEETFTIGMFQDVNHYTWSFQGNHRPLDWLTQRLTVGMDLVHERNRTLWPRHPDGAEHFFGPLSEGQKEVENWERENITVDYATTGSFDVSEDLNSATSFGLQYYRNTNSVTVSEGRLFAAPALETVGAAAQKTADEAFVENKTFGVYGQQRFSWRDRLFVTAALRADDNSAFGVDIDPVIYPKVSANWVVTDESFWNVDAVDQLQLRGAYGKAGQQPDAFAAIQTYGPVTGANDGPGVLPENPGNPELKPERGEEFEIGFDGAFFGERLAAEFTYYRQKTKDAIIEKGVSPSSGFSGTQFVNFGQISNWGIEAKVDGRVVATPSFRWDLGVNVGHNQNRIDRLGVPPIATGGGRGTIWHYEGYPIGGFWDRKVVQAEEDASGNVVNVRCAGGPENDHQPVSCDEAPDVFLGAPGPMWEGAVNSAVTVFGNLRIAAQIDVKADQRMLGATTYAAEAVFNNWERAVKFDEQDPIYRASIDRRIWGIFVQNNSWVKLREISASYTLPAGWVEGVGASRASVNLAGRNLANLWVHPSFMDVDPEIHPSSTYWFRQPQTTTPPFSSFVATVRMTF